MEQRMYKVCEAEKITYITIAHRPVLRAYQCVTRRGAQPVASDCG